MKNRPGRPRKIQNIDFQKINNCASIIDEYWRMLDEAREDDTDCKDKYEAIYRTLIQLDRWESNLYIIFIHTNKDYAILSDMLKVSKPILKGAIISIHKKIKKHIKNYI